MNDVSRRCDGKTHPCCFRGKHQKIEAGASVLKTLDDILAATSWHASVDDIGNAIKVEQGRHRFAEGSLHTQILDKNDGLFARARKLAQNLKCLR